jgi:hypothetical protein
MLSYLFLADKDDFSYKRKRAAGSGALERFCHLSGFSDNIPEMLKIMFERIGSCLEFSLQHTMRHQDRQAMINSCHYRPRRDAISGLGQNIPFQRSRAGFNANTHLRYLLDIFIEKVGVVVKKQNGVAKRHQIFDF